MKRKRDKYQKILGIVPLMPKTPIENWNPAAGIANTVTKNKKIDVTNEQPQTETIEQQELLTDGSDIEISNSTTAESGVITTIESQQKTKGYFDDITRDISGMPRNINRLMSEILSKTNIERAVEDIIQATEYGRDAGWIRVQDNYYYRRSVDVFDSEYYCLKVRVNHDKYPTKLFIKTITELFKRMLFDSVKINATTGRFYITAVSKFTNKGIPDPFGYYKALGEIGGKCHVPKKWIDALRRLAARRAYADSIEGNPTGYSRFANNRIKDCNEIKDNDIDAEEQFLKHNLCKTLTADELCEELSLCMKQHPYRGEIHEHYLKYTVDGEGFSFIRRMPWLEVQEKLGVSKCTIHTTPEGKKLCIVQN